MLGGRSSQSQETGGSAEGKGSKQQELLPHRQWCMILDSWWEKSAWSRAWHFSSARRKLKHEEVMAGPSIIFGFLTTPFRMEGPWWKRLTTFQVKPFNDKDPYNRNCWFCMLGSHPHTKIWQTRHCRKELKECGSFLGKLSYEQRTERTPKESSPMKLSCSCQNSDRLCFSGIHLVWINLTENWQDPWVSINWRSPPAPISGCQNSAQGTPKVPDIYHYQHDTSLLMEKKVLVLLQDPPSYSTFIFPAVQLFSVSLKLLCRFLKLLL